MEEDTPETPETPEVEHDFSGPSPQVIAAMLGGGGLHEGGVHGSVLKQSVEFAEEYMKVHPLSLAVEALNISDIPGYFDKDGLKIIPPQTFEAWQTAPRFRKGTATMYDLASFIAHVQRYKDDHTVIFADNNRDQPSMTAVLDYHEAGSESAPRFGHHRTLFNFPLSDEWKKWNLMDGKKMQMADFAEFIETHIGEIMPVQLAAEPDEDEHVNTFVESQGGAERIADPATMMQLSVGLSVHESSSVINAVRLATGEGELSVKVDSEAYNRAGEKIIVPTMFAIGIPVVSNGPEYRLFARLRYRKNGEGVYFWYDLWRTDKVFDKAFDEAVKKVESETSVPVWLGKPE